MTAIFTILALLALAVAATKEDPAATLLSPVTSLITTLGALTENARERVKKFIFEPAPPAPPRFLMSVFFLLGALAWTLMDTTILSFSLQLLLPGKSSVLISTGIRSLDAFLAKYMLTCIALSITIVVSLLVHFVYEYLQETFPQNIRSIVALSVVVTVVGIVFALCSLRYYAATTAIELNKSMASRDFSFPINLISKSALLSTLLLLFGILASGICFYLGFASTIHQTSQVATLILAYFPLSVLWILLIVIKRVLDGLQPLIAIPLNIMAQVARFLKWLWKTKGPKELLTILALFLVLSSQGCVEDKRRLIVAIFDNSGSFMSEKNNSLKKLDEILEGLELGDEFYFVLIGDKSFSDKRLIFLKSNSGEASIEDKMEFYKKKDELKSDILQMVNTDKSKRTDITGSLDRVQTTFCNKESKSCSKYLFIFSDLSDNISNSRSNCALDSVHVLVLFASSDKADYNVAQNQIDRWKQYFQNSRASSVEILNHDLSMTYNIKTFIK